MGNADIKGIRIFGEEDFKDSVWSGGTTRQLAIVPGGAEYADRDFLLRLSTAASDQEESEFTPLPAYDRILMVLEGDVVLAHGKSRSARLGPMEKDAFGGEEETKCFGQLKRDYNLIFRKGSRGRMEALTLTGKAVPLKEIADPADSDEVSYTGLFCLKGYLIINAEDGSHMLREGQQALIARENSSAEEQEEISIMGEGDCILISVIVKEEEEAAKTPEKPSEKAAVTPPEPAPAAGEPADRSAFADYKTCLRLMFSNNRWSSIMRREGKSDEYHDPKLAEALRKLERWYVTSIVWLAGVLLCFIPALTGPKLGLCAGLAAVFTVIHLFLIAPAIYMKALPRPLCDHMKKTAELTGEEEAFHQEEIREDPHMEKLMRKYRSDGDNYFTDETSPLRHLIKK